jgi:hypothetical protein
LNDFIWSGDHGKKEGSIKTAGQKLIRQSGEESDRQ